MENQNKSLTGVWITTIINILISLIVVISLTLFVFYIIHFWNKISGILYYNDAIKYVNDFPSQVSSKLRNGMISVDDLNILIKDINDNTDIVDIPTLQQAVTPQEAAQIFQDNLFNRTGSDQIVVSLLKLIENKETTINLINPISYNVSEFARSSGNIATHIEINNVVLDLIQGNLNKQRVIEHILKVIKGLIDEDANSLKVILILFASSWGAAIIHSIITKFVRIHANVSGGGMLVFWAIIIPFLGFVFYPLISISHLFRNRPKKVL